MCDSRKRNGKIEMLRILFCCAIIGLHSKSGLCMGGVFGV